MEALVDALLNIYQRYPEGIRISNGTKGTADEQEIKRIGEVLNQTGGMRMMRAAHVKRCKKRLTKERR